MKIFITILSLLVGGLCFTHNSFSKNLPAQYRKDSLQIVYFINKAEVYYGNGQYDSLLQCINTSFSLAKFHNFSHFYSSIYIYYGLYYRGRKSPNRDSAFRMFNSALHWAIVHKNYEEIELSNYRKLMIHTGNYYKNSSIINQNLLIKQIFENIRFSKISNSKKHLYKTLYLLKELYSTHLYDKNFKAYFNKEIANVPISASNPNSNYILFTIYLSQGKYATALKCYEKLKKSYKEKKIGDILYTYYINILLAKCIDVPLLSNKISIDLKQRVNKLTAIDDKIMYYNSFTKLFLRNGNIKQAIIYNSLASSLITKNNNSTPLLIQYTYYDYNEILNESLSNFKKALNASRKKEEIKNSIIENYSAFNLSFVNEQINSDFKIKEYYQKIELKKIEYKNLKEKKRKELSIFIWITIALSNIIVLIILQIKKIKKQAKNLQVLTETQSTIFLVIGHDLRSPVNAIYTSLLRLSKNKNLTSNDLQDSILQRIPGLNSLLLTLDNLLYWAHSQQNVYKLKSETLIVNEILEEVIELLSTNIEIGEIRLQNLVNIDQKIWFDENHFRIIIRNLLQNAIKFTPKGGFIIISSSFLDQYLQINIKDSGPGFNATENAPQKGTGLGLKLTNILLQLNHGSIKINENQGTIISLNLPTNNHFV